jgi:hypothetical protein
MGDEHVQQPSRRLERGEITLETVMVMDGAESFENDLGAPRSVSGFGLSQGDLVSRRYRHSNLPMAGMLNKAADGIRTHDLLHGKQTL